MNVSPREMKLMGATAAAVLLGLTAVVMNRQVARLREVRVLKNEAQLQVFRQQRDIMRRPELLQRLERVRAQLPRHPEGKDVRSEISRQIQALAQQSGLRLTGLTPEPEEVLEDMSLHQLTIRCTWTGSPEALVGFLVRMQALGPVMDVRELRSRVSSRTGEDLSGSFLVDSAFSRVAESSISEPSDPGSEP